MSDPIIIYNLESITKCGPDKFKLVQDEIVITAGDGVIILPTATGFEISRDSKTGTQITKRVIESGNVIYPTGDTTIQAIVLNKNTINKFTLTLAIRDPVNNLASWTKAVFYFQYFEVSIVQIGTLVKNTVGSPDLNINLMNDNFQVIIFVNGNGNDLNYKASIKIETAQFNN
jgi:hypothetical protein